MADRLVAALAKAVRIVACQHPMPSGAVELIRREHDGDAYVRS